MTDEEYAIKLRAESHIDELAAVSKGKGKTVIDTKGHIFAKDGFEYRIAYFLDFDGQYYELTLSVGKKGRIRSVYNVGKITEAEMPTIGLKDPTRSKTEKTSTASGEKVPYSKHTVKSSRLDISEMDETGYRLSSMYSGRARELMLDWNHSDPGWDASGKARYNFYKELYSKYQHGEANRENYFDNTLAVFTPLSGRPSKAPDYVSRTKYGEVSSEYWYTEKGVIRGSSHWGEGIRSCDWYYGDSFPDHVVKTNKVYGICKWEDFLFKSYPSSDGNGVEAFDGIMYSRNDTTDDFFAELAEREETEKRQTLAAENEKLRGTVKDLMNELIRTRGVHYTEQSITKPLKEILARYSVDKKTVGKYAGELKRTIEYYAGRMEAGENVCRQTSYAYCATRHASTKSLTILSQENKTSVGNRQGKKPTNDLKPYCINAGWQSAKKNFSTHGLSEQGRPIFCFLVSLPQRIIKSAKKV